MSSLFKSAAAMALVVALFGGATATQAQVDFVVSFDDPGSAFKSYYADIERVTLAAGYDWASHFNPTKASSLAVQIKFADIATANGVSAVQSLVGHSNGLSLWEPGAVSEIRTGIDANGADPDIFLTIGTSYLKNRLWFDPDPVGQTVAVPTDRTDARSVLLHGFGLAFVFNGWRDSTTGALPGSFASTFDALSSLDPASAGGPTVFFNGRFAQSVYGGPVPLTFGNNNHLGNKSPRNGSDLIGPDGDLMNGISYDRGHRYQISELDLAIARDVGLPVMPAVPEPASALMFGLGLLGVVAARRTRLFAAHRGA